MLPKKERLSKTRDIEEALKQRQYVFKGPLLYLIARDNHLRYSRLAVAASRKLGPAVRRNRLRRLVSEALSCIKNRMEKQVDMVVYPGQLVAAAGLGEIAAELRKAFIRHGISKNVKDA